MHVYIAIAQGDNDDIAELEAHKILPFSHSLHSCLHLLNSLRTSAQGPASAN
jgi:hypothetical protein